MSSNIVEISVKFVNDLPGYSATQPDAHSIKIQSVYFVGTIMFWPTTGTFRCSEPTTAARIDFDGKPSLSQLLSIFS